MYHRRSMSENLYNWLPVMYSALGIFVTILTSLLLASARCKCYISPDTYIDEILFQYWASVVDNKPVFCIILVYEKTLYLIHNAICSHYNMLINLNNLTIRLQKKTILLFKIHHLNELCLYFLSK